MATSHVIALKALAQVVAAVVVASADALEAAVDRRNVARIPMVIAVDRVLDRVPVIVAPVPLIAALIVTDRAHEADLCRPLRQVRALRRITIAPVRLLRHIVRMLHPLRIRMKTAALPASATPFCPWLLKQSTKAQLQMLFKRTPPGKLLLE